MIVDNHPLVRRGLTELIGTQTDLAVCATAANGQEALDAIATSRPDLVITDLSLEGDDDGLKLVKFIRSKYADLPVLVLTMHDSPRYADVALKAGAGGFITMRETTETLLMAMRRVLEGKQYVHPQTSGDQIH